MFYNLHFDFLVILFDNSFLQSCPAFLSYFLALLVFRNRFAILVIAFAPQGFKKFKEIWAQMLATPTRDFYR
jgi:hypothetical protein